MKQTGKRSAGNPPCVSRVPLAVAQAYAEMLGKLKPQFTENPALSEMVATAHSDNGLKQSDKFARG
jgi:hypothetical protein